MVPNVFDVSRLQRFETLSKLISRSHDAKRAPFAFAKDKAHSLRTNLQIAQSSLPLSRLHSPPFLATMNFDSAIHVSQQVQVIVGLRSASCDVPRQGDRTAVGQTGYDTMSSRSHMTPFTENEATIIWRMIPAATRTAPGNAEEAAALYKLARNAARGPPEEVTDMLPNGRLPTYPDTFYISPGSPLFTGKIVSNKFISFLFRNMDNGHRVLWYDLTGREQFEWYTCWTLVDRTWLRMEVETRGLRGTDLNRITNAAALQAAMVTSPTLRNRQPAHHPVADWNGVARNLVWINSRSHTLTMTSRCRIT